MKAIKGRKILLFNGLKPATHRTIGDKAVQQQKTLADED